MAKCPDCYSETWWGKGDGKCAHCYGTGKIQDLLDQIADRVAHDFLNTPYPSDCDECGGSGECQTCLGTGEV